MKRAILFCLAGILSALAASALYAQSGGATHRFGHGSCLWAGLSANQPIFTQGAPTEPEFAFALVNDCTVGTVDTHPEDWKLVINGMEIKDSGLIFGNGPGPAGGWEPLRAGASYRFSKLLPLEKYFPASGIYHVSWRGDDFETPEITIRVLGAPKFMPTR